MIDYYETKEHPITKKMILDACKEIKANGNVMVSSLRIMPNRCRGISTNYGIE
jgi:hypothetical protein